MTQHEIDTAVATATGETLSEVRHLGFGIADPLEVDYDPEPHQPRICDWDSDSPKQWKDAF